MRGIQMCVLSRRFSLHGPRKVFAPVIRFYSDVPNPKTPEEQENVRNRAENVRNRAENVRNRAENVRNRAENVKEQARATLQNASALGRQWAQSSSRAASANLNSWWSQYEEFVGINEVREAQTQVTQAESDFMVSRSLVREAHVSLEALQVRLKEVRERLDRVSREEPRYLELATVEHKLLQEDRRLRSAYELAESSEREKFALFSAAVRASHEKERTRAERTKNWSIIGSVLGALIGVMGSTYVNRVRLQELKTLLLEAQKGPENLQEALRAQASNHRTQQDELGSLIGQMRLALLSFTTSHKTTEAPPQIQSSPAPSGFDSALHHLQEEQQATQKVLDGLKTGLESMQSDVAVVKMIVEQRRVVEKPEEPQKTEKTQRVEVKPAHVLNEEVLVRSLEDAQINFHERIRRSELVNTVVVSTASAITVSALYLLLRGATP